MFPPFGVCSPLDRHGYKHGYSRGIIQAEEEGEHNCVSGVKPPWLERLGQLVLTDSRTKKDDGPGSWRGGRSGF
jgi:hypothetical protein